MQRVFISGKVRKEGLLRRWCHGTVGYPGVRGDGGGLVALSDGCAAGLGPIQRLSGSGTMLKLYGGTRSRAAIVAWYLEELAVPYEFVRLDMAAGAHRQPDYLAINPMGKVPALVDGETVVWESGAILLYLADKYGQLPADVRQRAPLYQWVLFSNSTLVQALAQAEKRDQELGKLLPPLEQILRDQAYITGSALTVADVALASILGFAAQMFGVDMQPYPALAAYVQRCRERPAFQKAMGGIASPT